MISHKKLRARSKNKNAAFTLLELLLSLALIVVATGLIGYIMQLYARNFSQKSDDIRRKQLARAVLVMIADDIRAVVLEQEYDGSVLEAQLGGSSDSSSSGTTTGTSGDTSLASQSSGTEDLTDTSAAATDSLATTEISTAYPPGIYGDQYSLIVEVSRLPRYDEYLVQQQSLMTGSLTDVPGDIKTVQYFVQSESSMGVSDDMEIFANGAVGQPNVAAGFSSGLIRRALDRGITAYAEEVGDTDRLQRTGDIVAPEVIALEFAYYDGEQAQWVYQWDSSEQGLPWLVQISLAMQSEEGAKENPISVGTPLSNLTFEDQKASGVEVYELVVAIPGANLVAGDSADTAAGLDSVGL